MNEDLKQQLEKLWCEDTNLVEQAEKLWESSEKAHREILFRERSECVEFDDGTYYPEKENMDSVNYFMTKMTQAEWEERSKGHEKVPYEFNKLDEVSPLTKMHDLVTESLDQQMKEAMEPVLKPTEPSSTASNAINPTLDRLKSNEGLECK